MKQYSSKLLSKKELTSNMVELHFERPENFDFQSGQFLQILVPTDDKPAPRSYSICSTPADQDITLCIKLLGEGIGSNYIRNLNESDDVELRGPAGHFVLNEDVPLLCVSTGSGIAPVISLIRDHLENKKADKKIHLLFGLRSQEDLFFQDEFQRLADAYPNFTYTTTLSQPKDGWKGLSGRVTAHIPDIDADTHAYLCGSADMVQEVRKMLLDSDVEAGRIHFEIF